MPDETYRIEVFKAGTHTAMNGVTKEYTVDDLHAMADKYNGQTEHKAPLVLGHPQIDDPAFGWADRFEVVGQKLLAFVSQVPDKLKEAVKVGMFRNVSLAIFADGLIRHIGLLGAAPPAVQGLAPVQFAEDQEFVEYAWATDEWRMPRVAKLFRGLRDWMIGKFSLEEADAIIPSDSIDYLTDSAPSTFIPDASSIEGVAGYTKPNSKEDTEIMDEKRFKELEDRYGKLIEDFGKLSNDFAAAREEISTLKTDLATSQTDALIAAKKHACEIAGVEFSAYVDGLIRDGKVLPAEKDALSDEFKDVYAANAQLQFADGERDLVTKFKDRLNARPQAVKPSVTHFARQDNAAPSESIAKIGAEFASVAGKLDPASIDMDGKIQAYADENKCSYEEAAIKVNS